MEPVTLAVVALAGFLIMALPLRYALVVYIASMVWYPIYLGVSIGTVDLPATRLTILIVFMKIFTTSGAYESFNWKWLDSFVVLAAFGELVSGVMTSPFDRVFENRMGAAFDTVLPYFAVRLILTSREDYVAFLRGLILVGAPLAIMGGYECLTRYSMFAPLRQFSYMHIPSAGHALNARAGLFRAETTFPQPIMFGLYMAMCMALCVGLWKMARDKWRIGLGLALLAVGVASSLSSGPYMAITLSLLMVALFPLRRYATVAIVLFVLFLAAVDLASNRAWYEVLASYATLDPGTAYYRIGLIQEAFSGGMSGHWIIGYGPIVTSSSMKSWYHTDITNQFILIAIRYGLTGLLPFIGAIVAGFHDVRVAMKASKDEAAKFMVWAVMAAMIGATGALFSVSLFGQTMNMFHMMLAICASMPAVVAHGRIGMSRGTGAARAVRAGAAEPAMGCRGASSRVGGMFERQCGRADDGGNKSAGGEPKQAP